MYDFDKGLSLAERKCDTYMMSPVKSHTFPQIKNVSMQCH